MPHPATIQRVPLALATACLFSIGTLPVAAAQLDVLPTIEDFGPVKGVPQGQAIDTLGIYPGQPTKEALAQLEALEGRPVKPQTRSVGVADDQGHSISSKYVAAASAFFDADGVRNSMNVTFVSEASGARAVSVTRTMERIDHSEFSKPALLKSFEEKYGTPTASYRGDIGGYANDILAYVWFQGKKATLTAEQLKNLPYEGRQPSPGKCLTAIGYNNEYTFVPSRKTYGQPELMGCNLVIKVGMQPGTRPDLVRSVSISITDFERVPHQDKILDAFLVGEITKMRASTKGTAAPKL